MFADYVKMGVKIGLIAVVTVAVIAIFANIQLPTVDWTFLTAGIGKAKAIMFHWIPASQVVFPVAMACLLIQFAIIEFKFAMIAVRWLFKINE